MDFPNHTFVTFISAIRIELDMELTKPRVCTLICSAKAPTELYRFPNFDLNSLVNPDELSVGVYIKRCE
jgi:hypothetical protein